MHDELQEDPYFHRHAEATTPELFYDLFFVANLTTFTSMLEISDSKSLTAYVGFFSPLWLTWYQVTLYDVRFSTDSVFERVAKALHYGPGQEQKDYHIYRAFGFILLVSRLTLVCQYGITLLFSCKYKKIVLPLAVIMGSTTVAAILYGALTSAFPTIKYNAAGNYILQTSNVYIAWYFIGLAEIIVTVGVSMFWRVISFKGTHMVQRMSLPTLTILGEGIIVICKSISKIVKNYLIWTPAAIGQVIASVLIIYFLYKLYFDCMHEEHFGTIKQQVWSFAHFPLHLCIVLALQGVSLLIIWFQAVRAQDALRMDVINYMNDPAVQNMATGTEFAAGFNQTLYATAFNYVPKSIDASKNIKTIKFALEDMAQALDILNTDHNNATAATLFGDSTASAFATTCKTLFETMGITLPKTKTLPVIDQRFVNQYLDSFDLVFSHVFIAGGLALIFNTLLAFLSLPAQKRRPLM